MTRCTIQPNDPPLSLDNLLESYSEAKYKVDEFTKMKDGYNTTIKDAMKDIGIKEYDGTRYKATITETEKQEFNDLQAIEILRKTLPPEEFGKIVKTREYIDSDALESAIYNHELDAGILAPCTTQKPSVITLRVTLKKGK